MSPLQKYKFNSSHEKGLRTYNDLIELPSITVEGGTINIWVGQESDDMEEISQNPITTGTRKIKHRWDWIAYIPLTGTPVVTLPDGFYYSISGATL
jgi:hypothetical protein